MTLTITNIAAHNLRLTERKAEKQDPYVYFKLGRHTAKTVQDKNGGLNSAWAEVLHLDTDGTADRTLDVKVYNKNLLKDDLIGSATVSLDALVGGIARLPLLDPHNQPAGEVSFNISGLGIGAGHHGHTAGVAAPVAAVGGAGVGAAAAHGHHGHHAPAGVATAGAAYNTPGAYNTGVPTTTTAQTGTGYTTGAPTSGTGYTTGAPTSGTGYTTGAPTSGVAGTGYSSGPTGATGTYNQGNPSLADKAGNAVASTVAAAQRGLQKTEEKVSKHSHHDESESSEYRSTTTY